MTDLVTLTINGREVKVPKGTLLVEAARMAGIEIPVFCYHPKMKPVGACRMCLVEIEKMPRLQTACTTPVAEGMVVRSNSPNAVDAQNGVIEFLLANHPLDCPICDKGGECPLQDNTFKYGRGESRFTEEKRHLEKAYPLSESIVLDRERCIMCYRCVRFQSEIAGDQALAVIDRGAYSVIGTLEGESFESPFSGNTIQICPVGALTSRLYRFRARPWDLKRTDSVCVGCAVGCNVEIDARDADILRLLGRDNPDVNDGWLCDRGQFGTLPTLVEPRPKTPMIREGGALRPATWQEALGRTVDLLRSGPSGVLASSALTNEAFWLLSQTLPAALPSLSFAFWPGVATGWRLQGTIADIARAGRLVLVGLDPWNELPVLALTIRKATQAGAPLVVLGTRNGLFRDTTEWLNADDESLGAALEALLEGFDNQAGTTAAARAGAALAQAGGSGVLLIGPRLADRADLQPLLETLADRIGANGAGGVRGAPALTANGRGAQELASQLAALDPNRPGGPLADPSATLLLLGDEAWPDLGGRRLILATHEPIPEEATVEVVLPLTHPYEQTGSFTNLEGRVQQLGAGGIAPRQALADWALLGELCRALGHETPLDLFRIRAEIAAANPSYARALSGGLPPNGRLLSEEAALV